MWILIGVWLLSIAVFLLLAHRAPMLSDDGARYLPPSRSPDRIGRRIKPFRN